MNTLTHPYIHKTLTVTLALISPAEAQDLLKFNTRNRPLNPKSVEYYALAMSNNSWHNGVADIAFDFNGTLLNGQHTLEAIVKSNTTQQVCVKSGMLPSAILVYDSGKSRTPGLRYALAQGGQVDAGRVQLAKLRFSIGRIMFTFEQSAFSNMRVDEPEVFSYMTKNMGTLQKVCPDIKEKRRKGFKRSGVLAAFAHYFIHDKDKAQQFYDLVYGDGSGLRADSAELQMREYLTESDGRGGEAKQIEDYERAVYFIHKFHNNEPVFRCGKKTEWDF